jgi:hydroxyacylglutathione hydrolase
MMSTGAINAPIMIDRACADVHMVPMFSDNYGYIMIDRLTKNAAVVDPGEPEPIWQKCMDLGLTPENIKVLCTHHHADHSGGNQYFADKGCEVIGTKYEKIPALRTPVGEGDKFTVGSLSVETIYTPCHTKGHVVFYVTSSSPSSSSSPPILFSGDTLFVGGCGKFFEGVPEEMLSNMRKLRKLPSDTHVFCAHEYTLSNYKFLNSLDPANCGPILNEMHEKRERGESTVPSTIGKELMTNLFIKCDEPEVQAMVGANTPEEAMKNLREMKNTF